MAKRHLDFHPFAGLQGGLPITARTPGGARDGAGFATPSDGVLRGARAPSTKGAVAAPVATARSGEVLGTITGGGAVSGLLPGGGTASYGGSGFCDQTVTGDGFSDGAFRFGTTGGEPVYAMPGGVTGGTYLTAAAGVIEGAVTGTGKTHYNYTLTRTGVGTVFREALGVGFTDDREYRYGLSFVFDKTQEGPIGWLADNTTDVAYTGTNDDTKPDDPSGATEGWFQPGHDTDRRIAATYGGDLTDSQADFAAWRCNADSFQMRIRLTGGAPARATSVNLYRQVRVAGSDGLVDSPTLVATFDQTTGTIDYLDLGLSGVTFAQNAGFSETLESLSVGYELNVSAGAYHVVARVRLPDGTADDRMGVVSQPYAPDVLDWTSAFFTLPERPLACCAFRNLAVFGGVGGLVVVDPGTVAVVDTIPGAPVDGPNRLAAGDRGFLAVSALGVSYVEGGRVTPASDALGPDVWDTVDLTGATSGVVRYEGGTGRFAVGLSRGSTFYLYWYEPPGSLTGPYGRWTPGVVPAGFVPALAPLAEGPDGRVWLVSSTGQSYALGAGARGAWSWESPEIDLGAATVPVYGADLYGAPTGTTVEVSVDGAAWVTLVYEDGSGQGRPGWHRFEPAADLPEGRFARLRLTATAASVVEAAALVVRPRGPHDTR